MAVKNIVGWDAGGTIDLLSGRIGYEGTIGSGTGLSFSSSVVHSTAGGFSLRTAPVLNTDTSMAGFAGILTTGISVSLVEGTRFRVWVYVEDMPSVREPILAFLGSSGNVEVRIVQHTSTTFNISFWNDTTSLGSSSVDIPADEWLRFEVKPVSGAWEVRVYNTAGTLLDTISGSQTFVTGIGSVACGKWVNRNGRNYIAYFDDCVADDSVYPIGDGQCAFLLPNDIGDFQSWSRGGTDSGNNWDQVNESPDNGDTDYLLSTLTVGDAETEQFTSPISMQSCRGVKLIAVLKGDPAGASIAAYKLRTRSGSTNSDNTVNSIATTAYLPRFKLDVVDPATGAAWTTTGLANAQFGIVNSTVNRRTRATLFAVVVDYIPGQFVSVARVSETDQALSADKVKQRIVNRASSTESARTVLRKKTELLGRATENNSARAVSKRKVKTLGRASSLETALSMTSAFTKRINIVTETNSARLVNSAKVKTVARVLETDSTMELNTTKLKNIGVAFSSESVSVLYSGKQKQVGIVTETDLSRDISAANVHFPTMVIELNEAFGLDKLKAEQVAMVVSSESALEVTARRIFFAGITEEQDAALTVSRSVFKAVEGDISTSITSVRFVTVSRAIENNSPLVINRPEIFIPHVEETSFAFPIGADVNIVVEQDIARIISRPVGIATEQDSALATFVYVVPRLGDSQYIAKSRKPEYVTQLLIGV